MRATLSVRGVVAALLSAAAVAAVPVQAKVEGDTIYLGAAISLTGKYSANGTNTKNGYDFAVKAINDKGGVKVGGKSYKLKMVYYDDESTPARAAQLVERLINQDHVDYMMGPYSSGLTKAVAPVTEKYHIPMVETEAAARSLFTQGYKYMFAPLATSDQYVTSAIQLAAEVAEKHGKKPADVRVALAVENDPFSLDVRDGVVDEAKHYGMKLVVDDKLPRDLNDMSATLTKVKALKPDLLIVSGHEKGANTAARQISQMDVKAPMVVLTQCESAKIIEQFGKSTEGFLCPTQWAETLKFTGLFFGSAADYNKAFLAAYPSYKEVPYQTAQASAGILVWKNAFEHANSFDKDKLRDALARTDMESFYGPIRFDSTGKNPGRKMVLRQIQDGKFAVVAPTKYAAAKLEYPRLAQK